MSKRNLLIIGGFALAGWFLVDTIGGLPGFATVSNAAHTAGLPTS